MAITTAIITRRVTRRRLVSMAMIIINTSTMAFTTNTDVTDILAKPMTGVAVPTGLTIIVPTTAGTAATRIVMTIGPAGMMTVTTMTATATAAITRDGRILFMLKATDTDSNGLLGIAEETMETVFLRPMQADIPTGERASDQTLLNNFLAELQHKAYHVAYGALWDKETALDVVQESMLRFVQYYRDKPETEWPALFRSVLNSRINDQRRKRLLAAGKRKLLSLTGLGQADADRDEQMAEAELSAVPHDAGISDPEAGVTSTQLKRQIEQALATLAERQRQVFLLREQLGLSIRDTADILGCSENSIKQHHFRALRAMRAQLSEVWEHEQT
jgi:RNA polymerase sigma-70 factor (ECF subfamily)